MIGLKDVAGMTCQRPEEIAAVAEHEGLPELDAACLADYMMHEHHGPAKRLYGVLHHFLRNHAEPAWGSKA